MLARNEIDAADVDMGGADQKEGQCLTHLKALQHFAIRGTQPREVVFRSNEDQVQQAAALRTRYGNQPILFRRRTAILDDRRLASKAYGPALDAVDFHATRASRCLQTGVGLLKTLY